MWLTIAWESPPPSPAVYVTARRSPACDKDVVRGCAETRAKSLDRERRAIARIKAMRLGLEIRFAQTDNVLRKRTKTVRSSRFVFREHTEPTERRAIIERFGELGIGKFIPDQQE